MKLVNNLADDQFKELRRALLDAGEFKLALTHTLFKCTKTARFNMTDPLPLKLFRNLKQFNVKPPELVTSTDGQAVVTEPGTNEKKPGARKCKVNIRTTIVKRQRTDSND